MGIQLGSDFDVIVGLPLDSRLNKLDFTERDAIPSGVRYEGMVVYVRDAGQTFQLVNGITNADWVEVGLGSGGSGAGLKSYIEGQSANFDGGIGEWVPGPIGASLSLTESTTNPLTGAQSGSLNLPGTTVIDEYYVFTTKVIDRADLRDFFLSFLFDSDNTNYTAGDVSVDVYDVENAETILSVSLPKEANGRIRNRHFEIASNITTLEIRLRSTINRINSASVFFDDFRLGPEPYVISIDDLVDVNLSEMGEHSVLRWEETLGTFQPFQFEALPIHNSSQGKFLKSDGASAEWSSLPGGLTKNYFDQDSAKLESGTIGAWDTDDGAGAASAGLTLSVTTTVGEVLEGTTSLKLVKDAANRTGHFIKLASQTIDPIDRGKQLFGAFAFKAISGYVSGDLILEVYDVTNSAVLYAGQADDRELLNITDPITFNYVAYLESTTAQIELRLKVNNTNTNTFTMTFDEFKFGPSAVLQLKQGPVGEVIAFAGDDIPPLFLDCNGSAVSRSTYAELFSIIGTAHGSGDGSTTFNLPNYRGRFLRGVANGSSTDPDRASRTAMNTGGNTGDNVGSVQADAFRSHNHTGPGMFTNSVVGASGSNRGVNNSVVPTNATGGSETRPVNAYVRYIIRYSSGGNTMTTNELGLQRVRARATASSTAIGTTQAAVIYPTVDHDDFNAYNQSTGVFTVPRNGKLKVTAKIRSGTAISTSAANTSVTLGLAVNGTEVSSLGAFTYQIVSQNLTPDIVGSSTVKVSKGDQVSVLGLRNSNISAFSLSGSVVNNWIEFDLSEDLTLIGVVRNDEYLEASRTPTSSSIPAAGVIGDVVEIPLSPGTWDLYGAGHGSATAGFNQMILKFSTTPGNITLGTSAIDWIATSLEVSTGTSFNGNIFKGNVTVTEPTTYYLKWRRINTNTTQWGGKISARRIK